MQNYHETKASLGCGTLILIAIIVAIFSNGGTKKELQAIENRLERIEKKLESLSAALPEAPAPVKETEPSR
jgi:F0F1-type ATP synthase membrane subunit b/b'